MTDIGKMMFNTKYGLEQAVLNGTKTMTRRLARKIYCEDMDCHLCWTGEFVKPEHCIGAVIGIAQAYKNTGLTPDTLIYTTRKIDGKKVRGWYPAGETPGWNNKMFVSGEYMRHFIKITDCKMERLHDISDEDCLKEGIFIDEERKVIDNNIYAFDMHGNKHTSRWYFPTPKAAFEGLITKLNGKDFWKLNPYVYVYSFELIKPKLELWN